MLVHPVPPLSPLRPFRSFPAFLPLLALAFAGRAQCADAVAADSLDSYRAAVAMDFPRAAAAAHAANRGPAPSAEARFDLAIVLLNEQPQSDGKLEQARQLLAELAADASLSANLRAASLYFQGRLEQSHARPVNPAAAARLYAQVFEEHGQTAYAERAFAMYAVIRQYEPMPVAEKRRQLEELDRQATVRLRSPLAQRLYHLSAGLAWSRLLQDDTQAYAHYLRVHELGLQNDYESSNLLVRLAELSRRRGDAATALKFFREFVARFPADRRTSLAREWIAELEAKP